MSHYRPYPAYKDSGVEWIGEVPEHWDVARLKNLIASCQNGVWGDDPLEDETDTLCIRVADFDRERLMVVENPQTYRQISQDHQNSRLVEKGDLLLEKSGGGEKTLVGANVQYLGDEKAVCSNFVAVIKVSEYANSTWLNMLMASMYDRQINIRSIKQSTGIQNLDSEQYLNEHVAFPRRQEQKAIADAINRETTRIDTLIAKKTRFIELLKEKRQAFITHAVTKGLDPDVPMKDSGIEWIGEAPEHWDVKRLRHVAMFNNSNVDKKSYEDQNEVKLCNYTDVYYNDFITPDLDFMDATASNAEVEKFRLKKGDVIITKDSEDPRDIGIPALVMQDMDDIVCGYHLTVIKTHENDLSGFIHRSIQAHSTKAHFFVESPGITRFGLDQDAIGDIPVCVPPKKERVLLTEVINQETTRIDTLIEKTKRSIELLKERRSAFITAAVTGQIDLREEKL